MPLHNKPTVKIILHLENCKAFFLKSATRKYDPPSPILLNVLNEVSVHCSKARENANDTQRVKGDVS